MDKHFLLMRDVITRYHPAFKKSKELCQYGLGNANIFNVERLVEESLAHIGGYKFVDEDGYDFTDYSDSKTTSINLKTRAGSIGSVENKVGALRITAYNPFKQGLDYFFVPKRELARIKKPCYGVNDHKERVLFTYSKVKDNDYGYFEDYRLGDFKSLAKAA